VSRDAAAGLSAILSRPLGECPVGSRAEREIADLVSRVRRHFLGHELKSYAVLAELLPGR